MESAPLESTGGKVWEASLRSFDILSSILCDKSTDQDLHVLELGSGCGWLGLRLAQTHTNAHLVMSEQKEFGALEWLQHNMSLNPSISVRAVELNWESIPGEIVSQKWDMIIGCELVYSYKGAELLVGVIDQLLNTPDSVCYYCHTLNRFESVDAHFLRELRKRDFQIEVVHGDLIEPGEYTELFPEKRLIVFRFRRTS